MAGPLPAWVGVLLPAISGVGIDILDGTRSNEERRVGQGIGSLVMAQRILYLLPKRYCSHCRKTFKPRPQGVLPKSLYGNQLVATAATMHYLHGIPLGRICEQMGIGPGSLIEILHRMARLFANAPGGLIEKYRQSPVKHADETGWRNDGQNGYAWLFATDKISIFLSRRPVRL